MLPVVAAAETWEAPLQVRDLDVFLDIEAARCALVKGQSPIVSAAQLAGEAWPGRAACGASAWFAGGPSCSYPADAPSRMAECLQCREAPAALPEAIWDREAWLSAGRWLQAGWIEPARADFDET